MPVPKPLLSRMNLSRSLAVMAGNVLTTGLLVLFLNFPRDSGLLWLFPVGALLLGRRYGNHLWRDFFTDRFSALGLGGLALGLILGLCYSDPLWLTIFWLTIGGGLLGLGWALPGLKLLSNSDLISPEPSVHYPIRVNRLLSILWGWLIWSIPSIPIGWRAPLAILFVTLGLMSVGNWQLGIEGKELTIGFKGVINISYQFNLDRFQRLLLVKLQEGGISWLQLTNPQEELTLPSILLESTVSKSDITDILSQRYPLARQVTTRDSLQMMGILLPQAMGVFAGISCLVLGTILWTIIRIPESQSYAITWLLGSSFILSPILASCLFLLVVPGSIPPPVIVSLPPWELGVIIILVYLFSQGDVMPLLLATIVFLSWGVGICMFQLVRLVPIISKLN